VSGERERRFETISIFSKRVEKLSPHDLSCVKVRPATEKVESFEERVSLAVKYSLVESVASKKVSPTG